MNVFPFLPGQLLSFALDQHFYNEPSAFGEPPDVQTAPMCDRIATGDTMKQKHPVVGGLYRLKEAELLSADGWSYSMFPKDSLGLLVACHHTTYEALGGTCIDTHMNSVEVYICNSIVRISLPDPLTLSWNSVWRPA